MAFYTFDTGMGLIFRDHLIKNNYKLYTNDTNKEGRDDPYRKNYNCFTQVYHFIKFIRKSGWPSGLRRWI